MIGAATSVIARRRVGKSGRLPPGRLPHAVIVGTAQEGLRPPYRTRNDLRENHRSSGAIPRMRAECAAKSSRPYFRWTRLSDGGCFAADRPAATAWPAGSAAAQSRRRSSGRHCRACARRSPRRTCTHSCRCGPPLHSAAGRCRNIRSSAGVAAPWCLSSGQPVRSSAVYHVSTIVHHVSQRSAVLHALCAPCGRDLKPEQEIRHGSISARRAGGDDIGRQPDGH